MDCLYRVDMTGGVPGGTIDGWWAPLTGGSLGTPHGDHRTLAFLDNTTLLDTNDGGIYALTNPQGPLASDHWMGIGANIQAIEFWSVAYDTIHGTIFGGCQDNGNPTQAPPSATWYNAGGGDGFRTAVDNTTTAGDSLHYETSNGSIGIYDTPGVQAGSTYHALALASSASNARYGGLNTADYATYKGNQGKDANYPYAVNNFDGTAPEPFLLGMTGVTRVSTWVLPSRRTLAPSSMKGNVVSCISYASADGALLWHQQKPTVRKARRVVPFSQITDWPGANPAEIVADPGNYQIVYVLDSSRHIWRTTDAAAKTPAWIDVTGNLVLPDLDTIDLYPGTRRGVGCSLPAAWAGSIA